MCFTASSRTRSTRIVGKRTLTAGHVLRTPTSTSDAHAGGKISMVVMIVRNLAGDKIRDTGSTRGVFWGVPIPG